MIRSLNNLHLVRFEPELHSQVLYRWYYSGDYQEFFRNYPSCPSAREIAESAIGKTFMIQYEGDGRFLGCVMHFNEKEFSRNFEVGCLVDAQFQKHSVGITALKILLNWKFNYCNLYKMKVNFVSSNKRIQKILDSFGAHQEGTFKKEVFINGEFYDIAAYAMFKKDFNTRYKKEFETIDSRLEVQKFGNDSNVRILAEAI